MWIRIITTQQYAIINKALKIKLSLIMTKHVFVEYLERLKFIYYNLYASKNHAWILIFLTYFKKKLQSKIVCVKTDKLATFHEAY